MALSAGTLAAALSGILPRLESCGSWAVVTCSFFCVVHIMLLLLIRFLQRSSVSQRLPLLQQGAWPRHGLNRICAMLHSTVVFPWACAVIWAEGALWRGPRESPYFGFGLTELQRPLLLFSLSFLIYDTVYVLIERDYATILHHLAALGGLVYGITHAKAGAEFVAALAVGECSTPLLHMRYFARHYATLCSEQREIRGGKLNDEGKKALPLFVPDNIFGVSFDRLNSLAETFFVLVFFVARAFLCPLVTFATVMSPTTPMLVKVFALAICLISFFWLFQIFFLLYKRGTAGRARGSSHKENKKMN